LATQNNSKRHLIGKKKIAKKMKTTWFTQVVVKRIKKEHLKELILERK